MSVLKVRIMSGERTTRELKRQGARSSRRRLQPGLRAGRGPESRTGGGFCHEDFTPFRGTSLEDSTCTPRKKPIDPNRFFSTHIGVRKEFSKNPTQKTVSQFMPSVKWEGGGSPPVGTSSPDERGPRRDSLRHRNDKKWFVVLA
ncbi:hypothetical protein GEV33_013132 [Tenebrio molitor]|uniref:Uncharacterized protein n=1 Tax=Tenebrio molitor TaxID=7067 RepID=A0A8J6L7K8_TENMO|nr:hypothetical protein GEV33_013132 [Tenebrio molitor]